MNENILDRLKRYIEHKKTTVRALEIKCGFSNGSISSRLKLNNNLKDEETVKHKVEKSSDKKLKVKTIGVDRLEKILQVYKDLNGYWLLTGIGNMINSEKKYLFDLKEEMVSEPNHDEIKYLKKMIQTKDEFIEKLQKEILSYKKNNK